MISERRENNDRYVFDDVVVEGDNFRLQKAGVTKPLTPRAFDVLIYLVKNPGRVVEKQELFDAVWKDTFVTDDALIRAIKEIRQELGDHAGSPRYVETVRKRGYRFIGELDNNIGSALTETESDLAVPDKQEPEGPPVSKGRLIYLAAISAAVIVLAGAWIWLNERGTSSKADSIAVMPIKNDGGSDSDHIVDGITESLIARLSGISDLRVKASATVFRYKSREVRPKDLGEELGVDVVLAGRLMRNEEDLSLYLSLVDTRTENNVWSKQYDRRISDLITLQSEVAHDVARAVGSRLSGSEQQKLVKNYTENVNAHQMYLKGRYHFLTTRNRAAETASEYYRKAIEIDPNYALAYAGLAEAAIGLAFRSEMPSAEVFPNARREADRALELDDQLAEAHLALGYINHWFDWDWRSAENHFRRALELEPNNESGYFALGTLLCNAGRIGEGHAALERSKEIDPLNLRNNTVRSQYLTFAGRSDEALSELRKILELEPNFYLAHLTVSQAYLERSMYAEAIAAAESARKLNPSDSTPQAFIAFAAAKSGNIAEARSRLDGLLKTADAKTVTPYNIALVYNGIGDGDQALRWLERAVEQRDLRMAFLKVEPKWNNLRSDTRFIDVMRRVGLPQ